MDRDKVRRWFFLIVAAISLILGPFFLGYHLAIKSNSVSGFFEPFASSPLPDQRVDGEKLPGNDILANTSTPTSSSALSKDFHLIIPATSSSVHLCKLLLSLQVLRYPEPTIVGWRNHGVFDKGNHLFKITEALAYLESLDPETHDEDMVLLVDGFDVWLQLRPTVLMERYYKMMAKHDDRLRELGILGKETYGHQKVGSKILLGADKLCGPLLPEEALLWAAPESLLPTDVYGDVTDNKGIDERRPRYLNSGTIMGTVKEMREFFTAARNEILKEVVELEDLLQMGKTDGQNFGFLHSDQTFFGRVWGRQEVKRLQLQMSEEDFRKEIIDRHDKMPTIEGRRTEYGICLDTEPELFQIVSGWTGWLTWTYFNGSTAPEVKGGLPDGFSRESWTLPEDVLRSEGPYAAATVEEIPERDVGWDEVKLGTNTVSKAPYPLLHINGDKSWREKCWPDMWFHPYGEILQKATRRQQLASDDAEIFMTVDGVRWKQNQAISKDHEKGGAWRQTGEYLSWTELCAPHEDDVYLRPKRDGATPR